jgi:hypothetical protein
MYTISMYFVDIKPFDEEQELRAILNFTPGPQG